MDFHKQWVICTRSRSPTQEDAAKISSAAYGSGCGEDTAGCDWRGIGRGEAAGRADFLQDQHPGVWLACMMLASTTGTSPAAHRPRRTAVSVPSPSCAGGGSSDPPFLPLQSPSSSAFLVSVCSARFTGLKTLVHHIPYPPVAP